MHLKSTDVDRNGQPPPAQRFLGLAAASLVIVPPASADDATIWSATLSVKILTLNNNIFGCSNDYPFNARCSNSNVLSDDDFSLHGTTYEITKMEDDDSGTSRELKLTLNSALPANVLGILTLNVGNTALAFEDASVSSNSKRFTWPSSFSWSSGNNVALSITGPAVTGTLETFHTLEKRSGRFSYRFDLKLSEPIWIPFRDMRDHAFDVTNGTVVKAKRIDKSRRLHNGRWRTFSNHWRMTVNPADEDDVVSVSLSSKPCSERGALCTADGGGLLEKEVTFDFPAFKDLGVSIADAKGDEDDGRITFEVTLSRSSDFYVEVDWKTTTEGTATEGTDFRKRKGMIVFVPGTTTEQLQVGLIDDDFDDDGETVVVQLTEARLVDPFSSKDYERLVTLADDKAEGTIDNADALPRALLARFGRTAAVQVVEQVEERLEAPREPGFQGRFAGRELRRGMERDIALDFLRHLDGPAGTGPGGHRFADGQGGRADGGFSGGRLLRIGLGGGDVLSGSAFTLNRETRQGGILSFWSHGAQSHFAGPEGALSLGGDVRTTMFGADYAKGPLVTGLSLSHSRASLVTGLYPWLGYKATERVAVVGRGGVRVGAGCC